MLYNYIVNHVTFTPGPYYLVLKIGLIKLARSSGLKASQRLYIFTTFLTKVGRAAETPVDPSTILVLKGSTEFSSWL